MEGGEGGGKMLRHLKHFHVEQLFNCFILFTSDCSDLKHCWKTTIFIPQSTASSPSGTLFPDF